VNAAQRPPRTPVSNARGTTQATPRAKLSYKEARELAALPEKFRALEEEQARITRELGDPAVYRDAPDRVKGLQKRYSTVEEELMERLARWEDLDARDKAAPGVPR
jgi:ATP-binding cassette subfamily F protein uup